MMGGGQGPGSLIFQIKTVVPNPHQRMPDVEPEGESSVVPKKLLSLAVRCRKRKNSGPLSPPPKSPLPCCYQRPPAPAPARPSFHSSNGDSRTHLPTTSPRWRPGTCTKLAWVSVHRRPQPSPSVPSPPLSLEEAQAPNL